MTSSFSDANVNEGTLRVLSQQALEAVEGAEAIAIWDDSGNVLLTSPAKLSPKLESKLRPKLDELPNYPNVPGIRKLGLNLRILDFAIRNASNEQIHGGLSIVVKKQRRAAADDVIEAIKPIMDCLTRQMDINAELSTVRKLTIAEKHSINFQRELDACVDSDETTSNVDRIVRACIGELGCSDGVVLIPGQGLEVLEASSDSLLSRQKCLALAAEMLATIEVEKRVVVASIEFAGQNSDSTSMLGYPILDAKDRVMGLLCVTAEHDFSKENVRLVRAACSKLASLVCAARRPAQAGMSRGELIEYIDAYIQRKPSSSSSLFYLDLDRLHVVNDCFGHTAGDQAIERILELLQDLVATTDIVVHLSSDRFAIFFADCDQKPTEKHGETILSAVRTHSLEFQGKTVELTASVGVAMIPKVAKNASEALSIAEVACRGAKERGGDRVAIFEDIDASMARRRSDLDQVGYLQNALLTNQFVIYAQDITPLDGNAAAQRYELLVRMLGDNGEVLPPDRFLSAAERYQMMPAIDRWVIKHALQQIGAANNVLEINLASFSINVAAQSLADENFLNFVENEIHQSQVSPDSICFEITETAAVRNLEKANQFIRTLQRIGCRFALDDFGTGYSSFAYLKNLPVQFIKIDGVFVRDLIENPISEAIVKAATGIGRVMGAAVVAEHVENDLVIQKLRSLEVDFVQGFGIGRPRPLEEVLSEIDSETLLEPDSGTYMSTMTLKVGDDGEMISR